MAWPDPGRKMGFTKRRAASKAENVKKKTQKVEVGFFMIFLFLTLLLVMCIKNHSIFQRKPCLDVVPDYPDYT